MTLHLSPFTLEDISTVQEDATVYSVGDDLAGPPVPLYWPVTTREEARTRLQVHMSKQAEAYFIDPSVHYLKITDDAGAITSIARWHWYPNGYSYENEVHWGQYPGPTPHDEPWAADFNIPLNNFILRSCDGAQESWIGSERPCWTLNHLVTRPSQRGKGAARMLIQWGINRAEEMGVSTFLEAGVMGLPIYEKMGFRRVGEVVELDLRSCGGEITFPVARMVYLPN